MRKYSLQN